MALLLLAACGSTPPPVEPRPTPSPTLARSTAGAGRTVTDMLNRKVQVPAAVTRVVGLSATAVEFATALDLQVVGRPSDSPAAAAPQAAIVGSSISPDYNAIAALQPDLVLADAAFHGASLRDFANFPYPVYVLRAASYDDVLGALSALGEATGRSDRAGAVRKVIEDRVRTAVERVASLPAPTVLILTGSGREIYAGSDATYLGSLVTRLGAKNVLATAPTGAPIAGFALVELAQVASRDPGVVLVLSSGQGGLAAQVRAHPAWAGSAAVRGNRVYELDTSLYLRSPGPRVAEAIEQLAALLFPGAR